MKIAVVTPIGIGGTRGGAENLYEGLVSALNRKGHDAKQIEVFTDESSFDGILKSYCECFYMDLSEYDLVISTKAPTYMVRHPNHVSYLLHTIRVFYDRFDSELNPKDKEKQKQRKLIQQFDKYGLDPTRIKKHFAIGHTVIKRLKDADVFWNKIDFDVIPPATKLSDFKEPIKGEYIFLPGRIHKWKRVELVIKSMKFINKDVKLLIAGTGEEEKSLKELAKNDKRIQFLGLVSDEELVDLYSKSIVVPFVPINEDFGYVTIEAFKSKKPVITCYDSGEPTFFVKDGVNGYIVEPDPKKIAEKIDFFLENPNEVSRMGNNAYDSVRDITWENTITRLFDGSLKSSTNTNSRKIKLLVTDNQILDPPIGGGRARIYNLYKNFDGSKFDITYLGTFDWLGPEDREQMLDTHFKEILVPMTVPHIAIDSMISRLCSKTTLDVTIPYLMRFTPKYQRKLKELIQDVDAVIISHPWVYPYVKEEMKKLNKKVILVYDSQNFEYGVKKQILGDSVLGDFLSEKVKKVENELVNKSDLIFACSGEDASSFSKEYSAEKDRIVIIPNGASLKNVSVPNDDEKSILKNKYNFAGTIAVFLASGGYEPNEMAAEFIVFKLAPQIAHVNFILIGSVCDSISRKIKDRMQTLGKNVRLMGVVSEEEKIEQLKSADIALNPISKGSGTNIKIFDYLAVGLPLITTPVGARGIDLVNDENAIIFELSVFAEAIRILSNDKSLRDKISKNGRQLVEEKYDWRMIARKAEKELERIIKA
jgi:glycosyltransferase involved in cell wall biosynthesis